MRVFVERQRHFLDVTLSSLWRRRRKNLALLLVYVLVVFLLASVVFAAHALRREAAALLSGAPEIVVQRTVAGRHDLVPSDYAGRLAGIRGVAQVRERLWGYYYDRGVRANYTLVVPLEDPPPPGSVVVGPEIARVRMLVPGDAFPFRGHDGQRRILIVSRLLPRETGLVAADLFLLSEVDFRDLFGIPAGRATDLAVSVRNPREVATVAEKIAGILPDARPILREEILRTYDAVFGWRSGILVVLFLSVALAFAVLAWDKASGLSADEAREIGILKAVGWETSDVILLKAWEGIAVSLTAFLAGILLAYAHVFLAGAALIAPVLKGWSTLYPEFRLVPEVSASQVVLLFFLTVLPYTAATVVPSWRAATVDPDAVMRDAA